jgi:VanZ family protein
MLFIAQDKLIHIIFFLILTVLIGTIIYKLCFKKLILSCVAISMAISFAIGIVLETSQFAFPSRVVEWQDIVANGIGCILGSTTLAAALYIKKFFKSIFK